MTEEDIERIEDELSVSLPKAYRVALTGFPIEALAGNSEFDVWDDANALIELNRELRLGGKHVTPWPVRYFATGRGSDGCAWAMDLDGQDGALVWADRCHLDLALENESPCPFQEWFAQWVEDVRNDLESDGIDPDGSPSDRYAIEEGSARGDLTCLLVFILIAIGITLLLVFIANLT